MAIDWVTSEGNLYLLHTSKEGLLSPLIGFQDEISDVEDAFELISRHRDEILKICYQYSVDPSKIKGLN